MKMNTTHGLGSLKTRDGQPDYIQALVDLIHEQGIETYSEAIRALHDAPIIAFQNKHGSTEWGVRQYRKEMAESDQQERGKYQLSEMLDFQLYKEVYNNPIEVNLGNNITTTKAPEESVVLEIAKGIANQISGPLQKNRVNFKIVPKTNKNAGIPFYFEVL